MKYLTAEELRQRVRKRCAATTQAGFAAEIGVSPPFVCAYLKGRKEATGAILRAMKVSPRHYRVLRYEVLDDGPQRS